MGEFLIRYNLGRGINYRKWQITNVDTKEKINISPMDKTIILYDCELVNKKKTSLKIFNGSSKSVCSWVKCSNYEVVDSLTYLEVDACLFFNPKIKPHWYDLDGNDLDGMKYDRIVSLGKSLNHLKR